MLGEHLPLSICITGMPLAGAVQPGDLVERRESMPGAHIAGDPAVLPAAAQRSLPA